MRVGCVLVCLLALAGCFTKNPAAPSHAAQEFTLAPGESAGVADTAISVAFNGVSGDSRCPADALCIQGGDALVRIEVISTSGGRQDYALHTGDMKPVRHDDLTIALVELSLIPSADVQSTRPNTEPSCASSASRSFGPPEASCQVPAASCELPAASCLTRP